MFPAWAVKLAIGAAIVAGSVLAYTAWESHVYARGYDARDTIAKADEVRISNASLTKQAEATTIARLREQALLDDLNKMSLERFEEVAKHETIVSNYVARARSGDERLRVDIDPGSILGCAPTAGTGFTAGPRSETRAYLMPGITENVFRIAGDSAQLVRDYNDVIARYAAIVATCNAIEAP